MRFDVKNLIKKRIYCIVCKIFVSNMASEMLKFNIFTTKICKTIFCKYNVIIAEYTVAPHKSSDITSEFYVFTKIYTYTFLKFYVRSKTKVL
jgi:hypothetical protein